MKKKLITNLLFTFLSVCGVTLLIIASIFLHEIKSSPDLLIHIIPTNGTSPYYVVQHDLVNRWATYCTIIIIFACATILLSVFVFLHENLLVSADVKANRKEMRKQKHIAELEAKLEELKKD